MQNQGRHSNTAQLVKDRLANALKKWERKIKPFQKLRPQKSWKKKCRHMEEYFFKKLKWKWSKDHLKIKVKITAKEGKENGGNAALHMGIPCFIALCFIVLPRYFGFFYYGNFILSKSIAAIFLSSICSLHVNESHFGNT